MREQDCTGASHDPKHCYTLHTPTGGTTRACRKCGITIADRVTRREMEVRK